MMNRLHEWNADACRAVAREHLRLDDFDQAERSFTRLLSGSPFDLEALQFVADRHYARGELSLATDLLTSAVRQQPDHPGVNLRLGVVQLAAGDFSGAADSLQRGLRQTPEVFVARLRLGVALEQLGRDHEALVAYFIALRTAQNKGRWLNDDTTAPGLRDVVKYAARYVHAARLRLFRGVLDPLRERYGASELTRVEHSLAIYIGDQPANLPDPRQQPRFLYFAGVPSQPYYPRERFPWLDALEDATPAIRGELEALLLQGQPMEAFLGPQASQSTEEMLRSSGGHPAAWDAWFFYRHGERHDDHCARCPNTAGLLDTLPLVRIRDHAPETLFSVLAPGTHILPHRGVTNTRLVTHLPLIIPLDCALQVGGEIHAWREGKCITFDDTFEHEAWNRSEQTRVVLILDSWNPDLTEVEQAAVTDLVEAIGDFNDTCELPPGSG
jgi:aspartate beta-hydroxylase